MKFAALFSVALLALSCSKDKPKSQYAPLTADQRNTFSDTLDSSARTQRMTELSKTGAMDDAPNDEEALTRDMANRLRVWNCVTSYEADKFNMNVQGNDINFKGKLATSISGSSCPVSMQVAISFEQYTVKGQEFVANLKASGKYTINDDGFKAMNDVYGFDFAGGGAMMRIHGPSRKITTGLDVKGKFLSQKHGDLPFKVLSSGEVTVDENGKDAQGTLEYAYVLKYPSFTAELKVLMTFDGDKQTVEYLINGEPISEKNIREGKIEDAIRSVQDVMPLLNK